MPAAILIIIAGIIVLLAILPIIIAARPAAFTVRRSQIIMAPPEHIFARVADFRAWAGWSPWEGIDPQAERMHGAITAGVGAAYRWSGDRRIGEGVMTITEVRPGRHIGIDIEFFRPFKAKNRVNFDFVTTDGGTTVTWTMSGTNGFMGKAMGLVVDCDRMIGGQYEKGLASLKVLCESAAGRPPV